MLLINECKPLVDKIYQATLDYFVYQLGEDEKDANDYFRVEYDVLNKTLYDRTNRYLKIEVRCELGYDGMVELADDLNSILDSYGWRTDGAFFDFDMPGIMSTYIELMEGDYEYEDIE